jgi:hypothetical protein
MQLDLLVNDFVYRAATNHAAVLFKAQFIAVLFKAQFICNYIHIQALDKFPTIRGEVYNIGLSDANLSKAELCERIKCWVPDFYCVEAATGEDPDKRDTERWTPRSRRQALRRCIRSMPGLWN